jgi:hypothetical protein
MFDALTEEEAFQLSEKLAHWGHKFAGVGEVLSRTALAVGGSADFTVMWAARDRYYDVMDELYGIRGELVAP